MNPEPVLAVYQYKKHIPASKYREAIQKLIGRCKKVIFSQGEYFEGLTVEINFQYAISRIYEIPLELYIKAI